MNEQEMSQDPFFMFRLELRAGKELGQNCYDENDLIVIREIMELLIHSAETDEPEVVDLYKALKWFLIPSDYKRFTELVKEHLPQDALENVLPDVVEEKLDFGMSDFFELLEQAKMDAMITPAGITLWEEERQMVNAVSLMTAIDILEKKIEYENVFSRHC